MAAGSTQGGSRAEHFSNQIAARSASFVQTDLLLSWFGQYQPGFPDIGTKWSSRPEHNVPTKRPFQSRVWTADLPLG